ADRSFVAALAREEPGGEIVSAVIGLAQGLRLSTVAEGVERTEQVDALLRLGCDRAQGYLFSPAVPADQLPAFLGRPLW
ncbi:EAL domain-containing protein, partial [Motilibacter deserti]